MSELSALHPKQPATWTFVGATAQGTPALLDYFQPPWEGTHDPHRVQNFFHSLLVTRGLQIDDYILHYVPSPLLTDATFIYGKRGQEGCLTHVVWSAQWNETWREQYCHYIPRMSTAQSVLERSGLRGYECSFLLDGRRVEANGILSLYPGAQLEIELDLNASSTGDTSSQQEDVDGPDEATLWQVSQALYRQGQSPKIQGLPLTCRPNADITLDFDDFIPLPEGGRIIPPPNWNAHPLLRFAADNDAVYRNRQGFLTVDCRTWLLPHGRQGHQQPRDIQIRAQLMLHLAERIRHLWRDIVAPGDALRIQHVRPTPLARGRQRQSPKLHLLVEVNRPLGDLSRPTLLSFQQISAQGLSDDVVWMPWLAADVVTLRSIHQASMLGCEPHNLLVALADRARGWMGSHQQRHVAPGAYIPVWWDLRWNADPEPVPRPNALETPVDPDDQEDESLLQRPQHALIQVASPSAVSSLVGDSCLEKVPLVEIADNPMQEEEIEAGMEAEALSLMQRAVSRSPRRTTPLSTSSHEDDNRLPVHTFRMSSSYKKVVLFRSQEMTYIPQLTRLWQLTPHNPLLAVHQVWHGPADLESGAKATLLLELAADRNRQAISDDQMVLVDIALESSSDSTVIRRVLWTRRFMTRPSFLHLLSVQEFCNSPATDCHVEKNKITWHKQDTFSREFTSGDYVRLLVRGPNTMTPAEVQVVLCEQEGADAQRYLYTRSPSHSPDPSAPSNEGGESEFEVFHDSPVENHTPIHERPSRNLKDWMAGSSKNQNHNRQGRGKENVAPAVNPQGHHLAHPYPCLQPHVSDRWCAWQVRKDDSTVAPEESGVIDVDPPSEPNRAMKSTVLCLDDLVPMPDSIQTVPCKAEGLRQMIDQLMCPGFPLETKIPLIELLEQDLLDQLPHDIETDTALDPPSAIWIYTDGSKLWNVERAEEVSAWAFVVIAKWSDGREEIMGTQSAAVTTDSTHPAWAGASLCDSYQSEVEAIIRTLFWMSQEPLVQAGCECHIVADATSALYAADGTFNLSHATLRKLVRPLYKFLDRLAPIFLHWQKSHVGQVYNELADHLAKCQARAAELVFVPCPIDCSKWALLPWLWLSAPSNDHGAPQIIDDHLHLAVPSPLSGCDINTTEVFTPQSTSGLVLSLQMATHNVNSLKDHDLAVQPSWQGRSEFLRQQVLEQGLHVIGWQETRRKVSGKWSSQQFIGFEACANQGKGGTAIWVRRDLAYGAVQEEGQPRRQLFFRDDGFTVLEANPEVLILDYCDEHWHCILATAHAPTEMEQWEVKQKFWENLQKHLLPHVKKDIFLLVDANGRVGSTRDSSVGGYAADDTNENGSLFQTLLRNLGLWLPSTFEECVADIDDTAGTWLSRGGWKRIDFVAHNASSSLCGVQTWNIDFEKDVLQDDHRAVCLGIHVFKRRNGQYEKSFHSSLKVNTEAMTTEEGKCRCQQILKHLTQTRPSWAAPADTHAEHLTQGAQEALEYWFPVSKSRPKPSWISDSTWSTLASTRKARHQLRFLRTSWRKGVLREIFLSWRNGSNRSSFAHWQKQHDHAVATAMRNLHRARSERIRLMKADENHYLEEQARIAHDELHEAKGTQLWKLLKKSLPKYRNRRKKPLPMAEAHQQFTKHFADIEEAKAITMEQLQSQILQRSPKALHEAIRSEMPLDQLPSVFELEDAIRTLNNQKAFVGCIPAELLRAAPAQAAELLYPALLSFFRFYQQPATWKGGQYYPLYKGKGAVDRPGSFRAILLGNVVPKVFHKIVRSRLVQQVQHRLLPFQIGGLPHMSVHFAAHFLQTLRSQANLQKKSSAVLFFDLKSAFYRAQRSTVVADSLGYGDDPEDEDVVLTTLVKQSALDNLEVTPSLQKVIQELFSQTWCTVLTTGQKPQNVLQSVRGTRPGDPVADLAFTCIMKQILERFMRTAAPLLPPHCYTAWRHRCSSHHMGG